MRRRWNRGVTAPLPLRGELLPLQWQEGRRYARLTRDEHGLHLHRTRRAGDAALRRALREFYEAQARADIGRWLPRYLPALPRAPARVRLQGDVLAMGFAEPDGSLALDLALVLARPARSNTCWCTSSAT